MSPVSILQYTFRVAIVVEESKKNKRISDVSFDPSRNVPIRILKKNIHTTAVEYIQVLEINILEFFFFSSLDLERNKEYNDFIVMCGIFLSFIDF